MSNCISVYAEDAVDKQTSCADWSYFQHCQYLCSYILAGVRQLCLLAKQTVGLSIGCHQQECIGVFMEDHRLTLLLNGCTYACVYVDSDSVCENGNRNNTVTESSAL